MGINPANLRAALFLEQDMLKAGQYIKQNKKCPDNGGINI